jgi:hypothetical protein
MVRALPARSPTNDATTNGSPADDLVEAVVTGVGAVVLVVVVEGGGAGFP